MPRGVRPCDRKRCRGEMHVRAYVHQSDGRHLHLQCDLDPRHTLDVHQPREDQQPTLDLEGQEQHP